MSNFGTVVYLPNHQQEAISIHEETAEEQEDYQQANPITRDEQWEAGWDLDDYSDIG